MSAFTVIVIIGFLMILGGISLAATPLLTFVGAGYFIIILFLITGIFGIIRAISDKRYDKDFFFSILSLILGIAGFFIPGAGAMNNYILLYLAAGWFLIHAVLSIINALGSKQETGTLGMVIGIILGVLELILAIYSVAHPSVLAVSIGLLIGFYYIESGISMILVGSRACLGGNNLTLIFTIMGVLTILGGFAMMFTPLATFFSIGHCIILLFFIHGVIGIVRAINDRRFEKDFFFAIFSLVLGIIGFAVPGIAAMNSSILLYLAAAWLFIHGILSIFNALEAKKQDAGTFVVILGIVAGVLSIILGIYSVIHPSVLAINLGILTGLYFVDSGIDMIFIGSEVSRAVAVARSLRGANIRNR